MQGDDLKTIILKGKVIDAEKALRKESRIMGVPSLVPASWELVQRRQDGSETTVADTGPPTTSDRMVQSSIPMDAVFSNWTHRTGRRCCTRTGLSKMSSSDKPIEIHRYRCIFVK